MPSDKKSELLGLLTMLALLGPPPKDMGGCSHSTALRNAVKAIDARLDGHGAVQPAESFLRGIRDEMQAALDADPFAELLRGPLSRRPPPADTFTSPGPEPSPVDAHRNGTAETREEHADLTREMQRRAANERADGQPGIGGMVMGGPSDAEAQVKGVAMDIYDRLQQVFDREASQLSERLPSGFFLHITVGKP